MGNCFEFDSRDFTGRLNKNVSVIKKSSDNPTHCRGYILNLVYIGLGNFPVNKIDKIYIKNPLVGNNINTKKPIQKRLESISDRNHVPAKNCDKLIILRQKIKKWKTGKNHRS